MNILVVCQYYYPEQFQINEIAPELVRRGHRVTVLTGIPNYPKGQVFPGYENGNRLEEMIDGVRVVRTPIVPRCKGAISLVRNYLSFSTLATKKALSLDGDFDVVLCYQLSPITMVDPAIAYAKKHCVPLVLYCLDIWPESALSHLKSPKNPLYAVIRGMSKERYAACDAIGVTSRPFVTYLHEQNGVPLDRLCYIPQHAADSYLTTDFELEDNGVTDFMFAGNLGKGATLDVIVQATAVLKDVQGFLVHMVGDGSERARLEALAERFDVADKIIFHGNQPRESMPAFYKMADALLITLRGNNAVGDTMPGKLQTYMAVGKPVFGAINGSANEVITESGCGVCVPAGDFEGLANAMLDFVLHPNSYDDCGQRARSYFKENFTLDIYCDSLEKLLEEAMDGYRN